MSTATQQRFEFGEYQLDVGRRALLDRNLKPVELPTKAFDALVYLVRNSGRVVERTELMDALWPRGVVEDNTLSQVVVRLRSAIGERSIVTLKGRGYQFVEAVRSPGTVGQSDDRQPYAPVYRPSHLGEILRYRMAAILVVGLGILAVGAYWVALPPESGGVAVEENGDVVPPGNAGTPVTRGYEFFLSGLRYDSRGKADANMDMAIRQYRRAVDEDPTLAIAWARLSSLYSESYFWRRPGSQEYGRLALEAAEKALALEPDLPEARLAMASYLRGSGDFLSAVDELQIVERDMPQNPLVPWMKGHALMLSRRLDEALASYERAIELSPGRVDFYFEPPRVYQLFRDYARAEPYLDRILDMKPDHVGSQVEKAWLPLRRDGDVSAARAVATQRPYQNTDDMFYVPPEYFGWVAAFYERDYLSALRYLDVWTDDAFRATLADYIPKASLYGITYELLGDRERAAGYFQLAVAHLEAELKRSPQFPEFWVALAEARAWLGDSDAALKAAQNALEMASDSNDFLLRSMTELGVAFRVFIPIGDFDAALDGFDSYFSAPGIWSIEGMLPDPRLDTIRGHPGFSALVEKYRRPGERLQN